ncbi:MAG TPA: hypothetical protein VM165_00085 [Planctomycetaceae bacterium]|nr:hypothetical protein [Planctomycetaceae bacterium]
MPKCLTPTQSKPPSNLPFYCPTPAQIRAACAEIQREWSLEERAMRRMSHGGFAQFRVQYLPESDHPVRTAINPDRLVDRRNRQRVAAGR